MRRRLTPAERDLARSRYAAGDRVADIARDLRVTRDTVYLVGLPERGPRTHCAHGHPFTEANTLVRVRTIWCRGRLRGPYALRECRTCRAIDTALRYYGAKHPNRQAAERGGGVRFRLTPDQIVRSIERSRGL